MRPLDKASVFWHSMMVPDSPTTQRFKLVREDDGVTLIDFIQQKLSGSKRRAKALIDTRQVTVNGERVWMARAVLRAGDTVSVPNAPSAPQPHASQIEILERCGPLLVANKPAGMLAVGNGSIEEHLRKQLSFPQLAAAHRLDRDTSGCFLCVTKGSALPPVIEAFRLEQVRKVYLAIVGGVPREDRFVVTSRIDGRRAESVVEHVDSHQGISLLRIRMLTGRTHQIRRHLAREGLAILGDTRYEEEPDRKHSVSRQMLHAAELELDSAQAGIAIAAVAPLPRDMRDLLLGANFPAELAGTSDEYTT